MMKNQRGRKLRTNGLVPCLFSKGKKKPSGINPGLEPRLVNGSSRFRTEEHKAGQATKGYAF